MGVRQEPKIGSIFVAMLLMRPRRLERPTFGFGDQRSIQSELRARGFILTHQLWVETAFLSDRLEKIGG